MKKEKKLLTFEQLLKKERVWAINTLKKTPDPILLDIVRPRPKGLGFQSVSVHFGTTSEKIIECDSNSKNFKEVKFQINTEKTGKKPKYLDMYVNTGSNTYAIELKNSMDFDTTSGQGHLNRLKNLSISKNIELVIVCPNYYKDGFNKKSIAYKGYNFLEKLGFQTYQEYMIKLCQCYEEIRKVDKNLPIYSQQQIINNIKEKLGS